MYFLLYGTSKDFLTVDFGLKNLEAETFAIKEIMIYGGAVYEGLRYDERVDTFMRFSLGTLASWGLRASIRVSTMTSSAVLDIVASLHGVPQFGMEIKTMAFDPGIDNPNIDELYSRQHEIVYPDIRAGTAIPVVANAASAGFRTDVTIGPPGFAIIDVVIGGRGMH